MHVLIVSHIGALRRSLQLLLQHAGHLVQTIDSVDGAFQFLSRSTRVDVVISEWSLGSSSAYELLGRLKQIQRITDAEHDPPVREPAFIILDMPALKLEHNSRASAALQMRSFGFRDVLEKPVNRAKLIAKLNEIELERRPPQPAAAHAGELVAPAAPQSAPPADRPQAGRAEPTEVRLLKLQTEVQELQQLISGQQQRLRELQLELNTLNPPAPAGHQTVAGPPEHLSQKLSAQAR